MTCCCPCNTSPLKSSCNRTAAAPFGFLFCVRAVGFFDSPLLFLPAACCQAAYCAVSIGCSIQSSLTLGSNQGRQAPLHAESIGSTLMLERQQIQHQELCRCWHHQCVVKLRSGLWRMTMHGHPTWRQTAQAEPCDASGAALLHEVQLPLCNDQHALHKMRYGGW